MAGTAALAATGWIVQLNSNSSAEGQSASINNLTISAVASPTASNLLYPGASGDVVMKIANPNAFPVTVSAIQVPANTLTAVGYSDSAMTTPNGCTASTVTWTWSTVTSGTSHSLTTPVTVAGGGNLVVTLTGAATMGSAPTACANTYFKMPSLTGVTATSDTATPTTGPVTDS